MKPTMIVLSIEEDAPEIGARAGDSLVFDSGDREHPLSIVREIGPAEFAAALARLPQMPVVYMEPAVCAGSPADFIRRAVGG